MMESILSNKYYNEQSVFLPENLLREARRPSVLNKEIENLLNGLEQNNNCPFFSASSWTTDAPYRETPTAIETMRQQNITCVEMEAAALYALAECKQYKIICFAHLTNSMAQNKRRF
jgi:purine-nucleoside phosphorylase